MAKENWNFSHNLASEAEWTPGLREIFEYRDLGIKAATKGDYVAHIVRSKGSPDPDEVQHWHVHHCDFQFVMVLEGWAEFEYEGCLLYTSPSPRDGLLSRMPSSA